jgi:hypothetical protein
MSEIITCFQEIPTDLNPSWSYTPCENQPTLSINNKYALFKNPKISKNL